MKLNKTKALVILVSETRRKAMMDEFSQGKTIIELAAEHKISPERVRQILTKNMEEYRQVRKALAERERKTLSGKDAPLYLAFKQMVHTLGRIPGFTETQKHMHISTRAYYKCRFAAQREGYVFKPFYSSVINEPIRKEKLLTALKELAKQLGRTPFQSEIKAACHVNGTLYSYYFGSLANAQKLVGLEPNKLGNPRFYEKQKARLSAENASE